MPGVYADLIGTRHVEEHAAQPIVRDIGDEFGGVAKLGAGEGRRDRVAAEGDGIILRNRLVVTVRDGIAEQGDVDVGVSDEQSLHASLPFCVTKTTLTG